VQGSCALKVATDNLLVPTSPCRFVVPGAFLNVPAPSAAKLWLDNLNIQVSPLQSAADAGVIVTDDPDTVLLAADSASIWLTNLQLIGHKGASGALRVNDGQVLLAGAPRVAVVYHSSVRLAAAFVHVGKGSLAVVMRSALARDNRQANTNRDRSECQGCLQQAA
jgi:hypothetical protein